MRFHRTFPPSPGQTNQIRSLIRAAEDNGCKARQFPARGRPPGTITVVVECESLEQKGNVLAHDYLFEGTD